MTDVAAAFVLVLAPGLKRSIAAVVQRYARCLAALAGSGLVQLAQCPVPCGSGLAPAPAPTL
jgi:hypothetical protein